jgi:hypothetical protein
MSEKLLKRRFDEALTKIATLQAENEQLRAENIRVSCHCAELIQELRNRGVDDARLKRIAERAKE